VEALDVLGIAEDQAAQLEAQRIPPPRPLILLIEIGLCDRLRHVVEGFEQVARDFKQQLVA
jgi:hypothetical protein